MRAKSNDTHFLLDGDQLYWNIKYNLFLKSGVKTLSFCFGKLVNIHCCLYYQRDDVKFLGLI